MSKTTIAVIGRSSVGTAALQQIVDNIIQHDEVRKVRVVVIESDEPQKMGLAYGTENSRHILNMSADRMSARPTDPCDFLDWLIKRGHIHSSEDRGALFPPRRLFGKYQFEVQKETLQKAKRHGIEISLRKARAIALKYVGNGAEILLSKGKKLSVQYVVLGIGNQPSTNYKQFWLEPRFVEHPWPEQRLGAIPKDAAVALAGSSLTSVDTIHSLDTQGHSGPIYVASRSGIWPLVRPAYDAYREATILTPEMLAKLELVRAKSTGLRRISDLWRMECYQLGVDPAEIDFLREFDHYDPIQSLRRGVKRAGLECKRFTALQAVGKGSSKIWRLLHPEAKREFLRSYSTRYGAVAYPCPPQNARWLLSWIESGRVTMPAPLAAGAHPIERSGRGFRISYADGSSVKVDWLIDATGQSFDLTAMPDPLIGQMLADGLIRQHEFGGVHVDFETGAVIDRQMQRSPRVFLAGSLTKGVHYYTNSFENNTSAARDAVDAIFARIWAERRRPTA